MAKTKTTKAQGAKIVIYSRIDSATVAALDAIREKMRPKPNRVQLINAALAEYVECHNPAGQQHRQHVGQK